MPGIMHVRLKLRVCSIQKSKLVCRQKRVESHSQKLHDTNKMFTYIHVFVQKGEAYTVLLDEDSDAIGKRMTRAFNKKHSYFRVYDAGKYWELGRWVMKDLLEDGLEVDHIDRDPSNNTRDNLRMVTHGMNMANRDMLKNNTSGYIGVYLTHESQVRRGCKKYYSKIQHNKQSMHLGNFHTAKEAACAYDDKCFSLRGKFAVLNFAR